MQVRGIGQLKLKSEVHQESRERHLCVIGVYVPPGAPGSNSPFAGHTDLKMTLRPKEGLDSEVLNQILHEATYKGQPNECLDEKVRGVCLLHVEDSADGTKALSIQCRGTVRDVEGLLREVVKILTISAKIVAAE